MNLTIETKWQPASVCHVNGNKNDHLHSRSLWNGTTSRSHYLLRRILFHLFQLIFLFCSHYDSDSRVTTQTIKLCLLAFPCPHSWFHWISFVLISTCEGHSSKSKSPLAMPSFALFFRAGCNHCTSLSLAPVLSLFLGHLHFLKLLFTKRDELLLLVHVLHVVQ